MSRPDILFFLFSPVTRLKGVGPALAKAAERLLPAEVKSQPIVRDLLFHLPVGLIDRRQTFPLNQAPEGKTATFIVKVETHLPPPRTYGGKRPYKVICSNETGDLTLVFFNASSDYIKRALPVGEMRVISGQTEHFDFRLQMTHPEIIAPVSQLADVQRIEPVYPLTAGLTNRRIASLIQQALKSAPDFPEWLSAETVEKHGWLSWQQTIHAVHAPAGEEDLWPTNPHRARLAYDEALANQLYLTLLRGKRETKPGRAIAPAPALKDKLLARLPFSLTDGQKRVLSEIEKDMSSGHRMTRLLQGDVGSGKTVVALLAALNVAQAGLQAAIMAPTEMVAAQHAARFREWLEGFGIEVALLSGKLKGKQREEALSAIESGKAQIIVGTHALFQDHVAFKQLGLMVVDEQHRFGVSQRMALAGKGESPHLLQMTATPIPRSLTMTLYGDMDNSLLTEKPAARQPIATRIIPASRMDEVVERLRAALDRGEKAYWVCPQIEDESALALSDVAAAETRYRQFSAAFGKHAGLVHGRMKADQREAEMRRFAEGDCRVLVATTVVEVGVDVPDATIMVVEHADRFGLAQLHQLRGRVGRSDKASACVLLYSEPTSEEAIARLSVLRATEDGFRIAEEDLRQRGGGDLLGVRQSGMPRFCFLDLVTHQELMIEARAEAEAVYESQPQLQNERGKALQILLGLFGYDYGF